MSAFLLSLLAVSAVAAPTAPADSGAIHLPLNRRIPSPAMEERLQKRFEDKFSKRAGVTTDLTNWARSLAYSVEVEFG